MKNEQVVLSKSHPRRLLMDKDTTKSTLAKYFSPLNVDPILKEIDRLKESLHQETRRTYVYQSLCIRSGPPDWFADGHQPEGCLRWEFTSDSRSRIHQHVTIVAQATRPTS